MDKIAIVNYCTQMVILFLLIRFRIKQANFFWIQYRLSYFSYDMSRMICF